MKAVPSILRKGLLSTVNKATPLRNVSAPIFSRTFVSSSSAQNFAIPSNLKLADISVLDVPDATKLAAKPTRESNLVTNLEQFQFALLPSQVPQTIAVKSFINAKEIVTEAPLDPTIFTVPLRKDIVLNVVRYIRHMKRQPKKTKRMSELRGSNKKPRPQKGQGVSQVGHRRNSAWRGGQKAFGPVIRSYAIDLNKKVRALGTMMTLVAKFREGNLHVVDTFDVPAPRTSEFVGYLHAHGIKDKTVLLADLELPQNFVLASRNYPKAETLDATKFNAYEVLRKEKLVVTQRFFAELQEQLLYMYKQGGKRKIQQRQMLLYTEAVAKGRALLAAQAAKSASA